MPKSSRAASNKRFQALVRAQKMNELLKVGGIQSQALLDSAGESRPSDESHVTDLLETERFTRAETGSAKRRMRRAKVRRAKRTARKTRAKKRRRR